ncbi:MAG: carbohydrate kinase family protein [Tissierellia bacterium]|nr:carbohydrate kinase family protein [Tissierellia bacterium]
MKTRDYAVVMGGANVDIVGRPLEKLERYDSNIGTVHMVAGGVGRNIAENLARRGIFTEIICAMADDSYGKFLKGHSIEHLSFAHAHEVAGGRTGVYLVLLDHDGEMDTAINDMAAMDALTPEVLETRREVLAGAKIWVMDTNLPRESIEWILAAARELNKPIIVDGVSAPKVVKLKGLLQGIHSLKCNQYEAQALTGIHPGSLEEIIACGQALRREGVGNVVLTLGARGAYAFTEEGRYHVYGAPLEVTNATGAGDAFVAALALGAYRNLNFLDTVMDATAYSRLTLQAEESVVEELEPEELIGERKEIKYETI